VFADPVPDTSVVAELCAVNTDVVMTGTTLAVGGTETALLRTPAPMREDTTDVGGPAGRAKLAKVALGSAGVAEVRWRVRVRRRVARVVVGCIFAVEFFWKGLVERSAVFAKDDETGTLVKVDKERGEVKIESE